MASRVPIADTREPHHEAAADPDEQQAVQEGPGMLAVPEEVGGLHTPFAAADARDAPEQDTGEPETRAVRWAGRRAGILQAYGVKVLSRHSNSLKIWFSSLPNPGVSAEPEHRANDG